MLKTTRFGDLTITLCACHNPPHVVTGIIVTSSPDVLINGRGNARAGDIALNSCGTITVIATYSDNVITNNLQVARINDIVIGCTIGNIVTSSENVFTN